MPCAKLAASPLPNVTGLSIDPTNETFYLSNGTSLYTLDPVTGGTVLVGNFVDPAGPAIGLVIDIANGASSDRRTACSSPSAG